MKKFSFILFFLFNCQTTPSLPNIASSWSDNQGYLNILKAKDKCASIGMRLPTLDELQIANDTGIAATWDPNKCYWSSSQSKSDNRLFLCLYINEKDSKYSSVHSYGARDSNDVRCIK